MKAVKLYARTRMDDDQTYILTGMVDFSVRINDHVKALKVNTEHFFIDCTIMEIIIQLGEKRIPSDEIESGYKGLIKLNKDFPELFSRLPIISPNWEIDESNQIHLILE
ncbi:MAG: hypothetical protein AAF206_15230 [Bacteroidota bacterium]